MDRKSEWIYGAVDPEGYADPIEERLNALADMFDEYPFDFISIRAPICSRNESISVSVCEMAIEVSISRCLAWAPLNILKEAVEVLIRNARRDEGEDPEPLPPEFIKWTYEEAWKHSDNCRRAVGTAPAYHLMAKKELDALCLLLRSGLMDDLPEGMRYTSESLYDSVIDRVLCIPTYREGSIDPATSVEELAMDLYRSCILPHIIRRAVKLMDLPRDDTMEQMNEYAKGCIAEEIQEE